jgi:hypothetical protein
MTCKENTCNIVDMYTNKKDWKKTSSLKILFIALFKF